MTAVPRRFATAVTGLTVIDGSFSAPRTMPVRDPLTERMWMPILGPTAMAIARLAASIDVEDRRVIADAHRWLGIKPQVLDRTATRLIRFGWATWQRAPGGDLGVLAVVSHQHPPTAQQARKLPDPLRRAADIERGIPA